MVWQIPVCWLSKISQNLDRDLSLTCRAPTQIFMVTGLAIEEQLISQLYCLYLALVRFLLTQCFPTTKNSNLRTIPVVFTLKPPSSFYFLWVFAPFPSCITLTFCFKHCPVLVSLSCVALQLNVLMCCDLSQWQLLPL